MTNSVGPTRCGPNCGCYRPAGRSLSQAVQRRCKRPRPSAQEPCKGKRTCSVSTHARWLPSHRWTEVLSKIPLAPQFAASVRRRCHPRRIGHLATPSFIPARTSYLEGASE